MRFKNDLDSYNFGIYKILKGLSNLDEAVGQWI